jgi:molybdopterin converting factor small subunit
VARVEISIPSVLAQMVRGRRSFAVEGETIGEALEDLLRQAPALRVHLLDDAGELRRHVLCLHAGEYARGTRGLDRPLGADGTITILNAVSGGR